jgi:cytochrome b561
LLTLFRLGWWAFADRKPAVVRGLPAIEALAMRAVHVLLYVAVLVLAASGVALVAASGAGAALFGAAGGAPPDFPAFSPFYAHATAAFTLLALLALHIGAALARQLLRGDRLLARMGVGRASS